VKIAFFASPKNQRLFDSVAGWAKAGETMGKGWVARAW
jgi:hypothetical protein